MATEKQNRAARRLEEREQARYEQADRDSETLIATTPSPVTAVDGLGVERIVTTVDGTYTAAQTDPDPKEVERLARIETRLTETKSERLAQLGGTPEAGGDVAKAALEAESSAGTPASETGDGSSEPTEPTEPEPEAERTKAEKDAAKAERDTAKAERDTAKDERKDARDERKDARDAAKAERRLP